jgi:hypothetical protein
VIVDLTAGSCTATTTEGVGETSCTVDKDTDPANPLVIAEFICPDGQLALQAGCAGTGSAAWLFATIQDIDFVQCFYRIPPTEPNYIVSVTGTCVDITVNGANGKALKATAIRAKDFTFAKLRAAILGKLA